MPVRASQFFAEICDLVLQRKLFDLPETCGKLQAVLRLVGGRQSQMMYLEFVAE